MGKRLTSKHAASGTQVAAARLRRLLVAAVCGGLVFVLSGLLLASATVATRALLAAGVTLLGYTGLALAKARPRGVQAGRRRAVAAVPAAEAPDEEQESAETSFFDEQDDDAELIHDGELVEDADRIADAADAEATDAEPADDVDVETDQVPVFLLEQLMQEAMDDEIAEALADEPAEESADEQVQDLFDEITPEDFTAELAVLQDAGVVVPDTVTHDLVPISSLHEARAEAERVSLQRFQATIRGLGVRTGDDPVAVDVLARVVAAVDRLAVSEPFERPVLSETGPLLAAAAAAPQAAPPAREATPLPAVPTMRPSDMPVTELSGPGLPPEALTEVLETIPDEAPLSETQPIDAVVVEDPDLVLPIPAPPRPQPTHRRRRLRRNSVA